MKNYEKPTLKINNDVSEGVYAASGDCYSSTVHIHQRPHGFRGIYRIQVNGRHNSDHATEKQILTITFSVPVRYISSGGNLISGDGTNTLKISYRYHQNPHDNIGLGDLVVDAVAGLEVMSAVISD